jgi:hypothetical protein
MPNNNNDNIITKEIFIQVKKKIRNKIENRIEPKRLNITEKIDIEEISCCKKYKKSIIISLSILGMLIIAGIIIFIVMNLNNKKTEKTEKQKKTDIFSKPVIPDDVMINSNPTNDISKEPIIEPIICGEGYYIPDDDPSLNDCQKCSLERCLKCSGTYENNECIDCGNFLAIYENEKIIECLDNNYIDNCEIGEEEKCKSCDEIDNKKCGSCNTGYKLVNGVCKSDYFIKLVYLTRQKEDTIDLINSYSDISYMFIEDKNITPTSKSYEFKEEGNHIVYIQFKKKLNYNAKLFENNKHLISVTFSDFGEYQIGIQLYSLFAGCINLQSVDFSKLSYIYESDSGYYLEKYGTQYMFSGCINLKDVNLKNIKIIYSAGYMFNGCKSLQTIDLSVVDISSTKKFNHMLLIAIL